MSDAAATTIRVGHSPDSDDAFMFYALTHDKLDTGGLRFVHQLEDIETLNQRALKGELEVSAVSIHAFAYLSDRYALLASGSSMGDQYGPTLVTREPMTLEGLKGRTIAIPGKLTTAYLTMQLCLGKDTPVVVMPFDEILPAVAGGRVEAGLLIHEGQLTYADAGLVKLLDLGVWWQEHTGLPLPLGLVGIRRDVERREDVSAVLREAIDAGLTHRDEAMQYAMGFGRGIDAATADEFVAMYVNDLTLDMGDRGREAVAVLLGRDAEFVQ
jgi:5,8-dihydroxy-2-naphthoate synthase